MPPANPTITKRSVMTKTMNVLECKEKFLSVVDEVAETGEAVVVIRNGRPVGLIRPYSAGKKDPPRFKKVLTKGR
jgi:antitoxin (DNA-binding transcriptional repressor) of toxin-antitoxin stability system